MGALEGAAEPGWEFDTTFSERSLLLQCKDLFGEGGAELGETICGGRGMDRLWEQLWHLDVTLLPCALEPESQK